MLGKMELKIHSR